MTPHHDSEQDRKKISALADKGELFAAVDAARHALTQFDTPSFDLRHSTVLLMARAGSLNEAIKHYASLGLNQDGGVEARSLGARLLKDAAFSAHPSQQHGAIVKAGKSYLQIYKDTQDTYPGINAATLIALAGDFSGAKSLAREILELLQPSPEHPDYWHYATLAEAHILEGDHTAAARAIRSAATIGTSKLADRASTLKQLRRLLKAQGKSPEILQPLLPKITLHYSGHMIAAPGQKGRIMAEHENELARRIDEALEKLDPGAAFGALASGSDILIAEHLIRRKIDVHVTLPFKTEDFIAISVRPAGEDWVKRFEKCVGAAKSLGFLTEQPYLNDDILFGIGAKLAMGGAILHASHISGETCQLSIWDGVKTNATAGTSSDIANWARWQKSAHIIDVADLGSVPEKLQKSSAVAPAKGTRIEAAMLFGDIKGFSKLDDEKLPLFVEHILGTIHKHLSSDDTRPSFVNTWGDGLFAVWDTPAEAAKRALLIQDAIADFATEDVNLPANMSMRVSLHYGVAHKLIDPILGRENYFGEGVARAARIEPITPPGEIYTTEQFAAMLMLDKDSPVVAEYVGNIAAAKDYGSFPLYHLRWKFTG